MKVSSRLKLAATALTVVRVVGRPGGPNLLTRAQCVPRLTRATLNGSYIGTTPGRLALVAAAAAYVISPVDLVPEAVLPLIGLTDDVLVLRWAVSTLVDETDRFLAWEGSRRHWVPGPVTEGPAEGPVSWVAGADGADGVSSAGERRGSGTVVRAAAAGFVLERVRRRLER